MTCTLTVPFEVPSQNETERGRNYYARAAKTARRRAMWKLACQSEMVRVGLRPATGKRTLRLVAYRARRCADIANLIGGAKACIDGLVDAGLILDDRDAKAGITYAQALASASPLGRGIPCTVVEVEDAPAPAGHPGGTTPAPEGQRNGSMTPPSGHREPILPIGRAPTKDQTA